MHTHTHTHTHTYTDELRRKQVNNENCAGDDAKSLLLPETELDSLSMCSELRITMLCQHVVSGDTHYKHTQAIQYFCMSVTVFTCLSFFSPGFISFFSECVYGRWCASLPACLPQSQPPSQREHLPCGSNSQECLTCASC